MRTKKPPPQLSVYLNRALLQNTWKLIHAGRDFTGTCTYDSGQSAGELVLKRRADLLFGLLQQTWSSLYNR
eukprot:m.92167 g.92167  ORF g.92167 m.92167 type:complete len:71 (+) comp36716_c0_seq1:898-1110(+)